MAKIFSIQAFAEKVGVSTSALRAWERRYQLFDPDRSAAGYRTYGTQDLLLYWYVDLQRTQGQSLAQLAKNGRSSLLKEAREFLETIDSPALLVVGLLRAGKFADTFRFLDVLGAVCESPVELANHCIKYMEKVGDAWHQGELGIAAEHAFTAQVKHFLTASLFQDPSASATEKSKSNASCLAICSSPEGELHEIGILRVAVHLKEWGFQIVYLGANIPLDSLLECAKECSATLICVSSTRALEAQTFLRQISAHPVFEELRARKTLCVVGGSGVRMATMDPVVLQKKGIHLIEDLDSFRTLAMGFLGSGKDN